MMLSKLPIFVVATLAASALATAVNSRDVVVSACSTSLRCCSYLTNIPGLIQFTHTRHHDDDFVLQVRIKRKLMGATHYWFMRSWASTFLLEPWSGLIALYALQIGMAICHWVNLMCDTYLLASSKPALCCSRVATGMLLYFVSLNQFTKAKFPFQIVLSLLAATW